MLFRRSLFGALMSLWAEKARRSAREWIHAALEDTLRPALRWVAGVGVSYLIAAGLALTAAVFLLSAASSGLVALGLPPWAAQLIMAVVAAAAAFVFYKRGVARTLPEAEEEDVAFPSFKIDIVKERPAPRAKRRRRPSSSDVYDVHPADGGWELTSGSPRRKRTFETKEEALAAARRSASKGRRGRVVVHGANGTIQDVVDYRA